MATTERGRSKRRAGKQPTGQREETPYRILDVPEGAGAEEIRKAYLSKVREFPPEREPEGFKRIQKAYAVLKDAVRRKTLDQAMFRTILDPDGPEGPAVDFGDLFRERVFLLLLASSDLFTEDFSRHNTDIDRKVETLG